MSENAHGCEVRELLVGVVRLRACLKTGDPMRPRTLRDAASRQRLRQRVWSFSPSPRDRTKAAATRWAGVLVACSRLDRVCAYGVAREGGTAQAVHLHPIALPKGWVARACPVRSSRVRAALRPPAGKLGYRRRPLAAASRDSRSVKAHRVAAA